jgi:tRNA uridine 5-carboxymethylaminomethyl modification enzyme
VGVRLGVVGRERTERFEALRLELDAARQVLTRTMMRSSELAGLDRAAGDNGRKSLFEWATSTGIDVEKLLSLASEVVISDRNVLSRLNADAKYRPYIERQKRELQRQREDARLEIPFDLDLDSLSGLSNELKNKFRANRPLTLAHAGRYEGVTPAALLLLAAHARRSARSSR